MMSPVPSKIFHLAPKPFQTFARTWIKNLRQRQRDFVPIDRWEPKFREAMRYLTTQFGAETLGDYLEFGVNKGTSLMCMYRALNSLGLDHIRLFGFDSFEGLPDFAATEDLGLRKPGQYKAEYENVVGSLSKQGVNWERVTLVKGFYSTTLNEECIQQHKIKKSSFINVDCDLYTSTKEALNFVLLSFSIKQLFPSMIGIRVKEDWLRNT